METKRVRARVVCVHIRLLEVEGVVMETVPLSGAPAPCKMPQEATVRQEVGRTHHPAFVLMFSTCRL